LRSKIRSPLDNGEAVLIANLGEGSSEAGGAAVGGGNRISCGLPYTRLSNIFHSLHEKGRL